jgi:23S rRNA (guanosine2251-2'-O)-methyltransferase
MNINSINALMEALREELPINKVLVATGKKDHRIAEVLKLCKKNNVVFQRVPQQTINRKAGPKNQGVFAEVSPIEFYSLEEILPHTNKGLILVLDGIMDTGNMGAIIRSAVAAEVDAIIIPKRNSAPINETVLKTSAGSLVKAKLVQCNNVNNEIKFLKEEGFWVVGSVMDKVTSVPYYDYDFTVNTVIIMGSEHNGISSLLQKNADQLIHIPHSKNIDSLNVSAATSVILFEALRQRSIAK